MNERLQSIAWRRNGHGTTSTFQEIVDHLWKNVRLFLVPTTQDVYFNYIIL